MSKCVGHEELIVSTAAVTPGTGLDKALIVPGLSCVIQNDPLYGGAGASVRFWPDGTSPSTGVGVVLLAGDTMSYDGEIDKLRFIRISADAKLNIFYQMDV